MQRIRSKIYGGFLLLIAITILVDTKLEYSQANVLSLITVQLMVFFGLKYIFNKKTLSAIISNNTLYINSGGKLIRSIDLNNLKYISQGFKGLKLKTSDGEDVLKYSDFDFKSQKLLKKLV